MRRKPIPLFQPAGTYRPLIPRLKGVLETFLRKGVFIGGEYVEQLEEAVRVRLGVAHAVGCGSGTSALELALQAAGIGPGDEVVTVADTYYATAYAVRSVGARPVFADILQGGPHLDPVRATAALTAKTRAILAVELYGWRGPGEALREIADDHGVLLIEDCAHAFHAGPPGKAAGSLADFACYSFYPTKTLGALGDAGLVAAREPEAAERLRRLRYFADASRTRFLAGARHARLDALQAAVLLTVLEGFDDLLAARRRLAALYAHRLSERPDLLLDLEDPLPSPYVFPIRVRNREALLPAMRERGIHLGVHYATDLHRLEEFGGAHAGSLPRTESHNASVVSLPVYPQLSEADAHFICDEILCWPGLRP